MLRLLRKFRFTDWLLVGLLVCFVVTQVYFDVELPGYTSKIMEEMMSRDSSTASIIQIGVKMLLIALGSIGASFVVGYLAAYLSSKFSRRLRSDVFKKVQSFSLEEINRFSTASLITRSTNDIQQVQMAVGMILRIAITAPITAIWAIQKISTSSIELTFAAGFWLVLLVVTLIIMFSVVLPRFRIIQKLTDALNGVTRENLTGLRVVKAYNADGYQQEKFGKVNSNVNKQYLFTTRVMALMNPLVLLVMNALTVTIYWFGATLIDAGKLDFPSIPEFNMLTMQVLMAFTTLTMILVMTPRAQISAKRINEILQAPLSVTDPIMPADDPEGLKQFDSNAPAVEFANVSFKYPDAENYVLSDISFIAKRGETVAFIGSTGSGKSTLINLVPRFYDATSGIIRVFGADIRAIPQKTLRRKIGYVPQRGVLFSGTVESNLAYGMTENPESGTIEKAAKIAMADEFIAKMQGEYGANIAQGGKNVSGGQRQRLSIARAVAITPELYIFDDSFSALDFKTDKAVRSNLKEFMPEGATKLIVAQRIGTIMDADRIVVLDSGCVVGAGTHKQLLRTCPIYREIALSQLSKEELGL